MEERLTERRLPSDPLTVTVEAVPANLAVLRDRLLDWLASVDVGPETTADVMLAVGEATANAAEHARTGAVPTVQMTVHAEVDGHGLNLVVSDNGRWKDSGRWKSATAAPGHRGHGLRLIEALVDSHEVTTTEDGTTVTMRKELAP